MSEHLPASEVKQQGGDAQPENKSSPHANSSEAEYEAEQVTAREIDAEVGDKGIYHDDSDIGKAS